MENPEENVNLFFDPENSRSTLSCCLSEMSSLPRKAVMSRCYCICSGLDILAQMYAGELSKKRSTKRIIKFIGRYMNLSETEAQMLNQFRNAVIHSYGQHAFHPKTKREYRFKIDPSIDEILTPMSKTVVIINPDNLEKAFLNAVNAYKNDVLNNTSLLKKFNVVHRRIGRVFT